MAIRGLINVPTGNYCACAGTLCRFISWCNINNREYNMYPACQLFQENLDMVINGNGYVIKRCSDCLEHEESE